MSASISCKDCGCIFGEAGTNKPCPDCRSLDRNISDSDSGVGSESRLRVRGIQAGVPGDAYNCVYRERLSGYDVPARETLIIDRRHPIKTVKKHRIQELSWNDEWTVVYDGHDEWPAKHRGLASGQA